MKTIYKLFILLVMLGAAGSLKAHDFEVVNSDGDTIYYNITSNTAPYTVEVTYYGTNNYSGTINIPETVTNNGITYSVTSIGEGAFSYCSGLTSVNIPNSVTSIGGCAFHSCSSLTSVNIPNSVTSIGEAPFCYCSGLISINVATDNANYSSIDGVLFDKMQTTLIAYPGGIAGSYIVPNSVTSIGDYAFEGCSGITSITIHNSVTSIGVGAFISSGLITITIPEAVISIGGAAFGSCSSLKTVNYNAINCVFLTDTNYNYYAPFYECDSITTVNIGDCVQSIPNRFIQGCVGVISITIPNSITSIEGYTFYACSSLSSVTIPNSVTSIGNSAFYGCSSLTSVTIPNTVTSIGQRAFANSGLTSITIPNSVTSIGEACFGWCSSLTSVNIPNSITSIEVGTFGFCSSLTSITIPNSVTSIGTGAFLDCSSLNTIQCLSTTPPVIEENTFSGVSTSIPLIVPCDCSAVYSSAPYWSSFTNIIEDCSAVDDNLFENSITMYPNPAKDVVYLQIDGLQSNLEISILDLSGRLLHSKTMKADEQVLELNINGLTDGVYYVKITNGNKSINKKLVVRQ